MDFSIPDRVHQIAGTLRPFVDQELVPLEPRLFAEGFGALAPDLAGLRNLAREMGLFSPHLPADHGGAGLPLLDFAHVSEILGRSPLGHYVFNCQAPDAGNMELLLQHGSDAQRERWLGPLIRGEIRSCFGMTEPEFPGSNPVVLGTMARREGDEYVIDGHKWFTSSFEGSAFCIVMAVTAPEGARHQRASMLIVPTDAPGFEMVRNLPVMGETGEGWMSHAEVRLTGVRVPVENRIGGEGEGFTLAQERLGPGRIHHCMRWIGICERAFDLMCRRAASRELAPGEPLGSRQILHPWIAESRAAIDAARLMVLRTAWRIDREGAAVARDDISLIKFHVAGVLQEVLDRAIQVHGGYGLLDELPLAFWWRHERASRIYDGPDEVHKTSVARRILAGYGMSTKRG
jgi:alkylation response protein AidB-like acyl-CoA dehydrogenase